MLVDQTSPSEQSSQGGVGFGGGCELTVERKFVEDEFHGISRYQSQPSQIAQVFFRLVKESVWPVVNVPVPIQVRGYD